MGDNTATAAPLNPASGSVNATGKKQYPPKQQKTNGSSAKAKKEVRILMLHGYTQSGPLFRAKTRAVEKLVAKALAPLNLVPALIYPTAPNPLYARDIPGYEPAEGATADDESQTDAWAWFRKDDATSNYRLLDRGMNALAEATREANEGQASESAVAEGDDEKQAVAVPAATDEAKERGTIDGVIGFSQGGAMAAMLAAAMETPASDSRVPPPEHAGWFNAVREANGGKPLKFAVSYSGFYATPKDLEWLYEGKVRTPTLHYIGSLDTVVDESRSQGLVERCEEPVVVVHPGGHYVPVNREWVMPLVGFVRRCLEGGRGRRRVYSGLVEWWCRLVLVVRYGCIRG
ncbi:serine hydrolase-domain-containing protein [Bombardia bombarda]|uniref:Serine hydrolase-domain-containing protein n=1 Tax=Bombardia bombarda TaxID=252184 RepID=A0AA39U745_9PEZI|nr:serine hydrolase-domain-containing protein [Bombardia bombarda]